MSSGNILPDAFVFEINQFYLFEILSEERLFRTEKLPTKSELN